MKLRSVFLSLLLVFVAGQPVGADEKTIFGPEKYDVTQRYGKLNNYTAAFPAREGVYVVKIQNGANPKEKVDWIQCAINGEKVVREDKYHLPYIAVFVKLKSENTVELVLRDDYPTSLRRPPAIPKNILLTVLPLPSPTLDRVRGSFPLWDWSQLSDYAGLFVKISGPASALAMESMSVQYDVPHRADTFRKMVDVQEKSAENFIIQSFRDPGMTVELRAEAARGMGISKDKKHIPLLLMGMLESEDIISVASARALAMYPETDTQDPLKKTLEKLDYLRKDAAIRTIVGAGWKPVSTMIALADSIDPSVSTVALAVLGGMKITRATDYLLAAMEAPGKRNPVAIIQALGNTGDPRAVEPLLAQASDPAKRNGREIELGEALSNLGDQRAAAAIRDMYKNASTPTVEGRLRAAHVKLTGKNP